MSNKIAILTALSGTREKLHDPKTIFPNADYFAFVDAPQEAAAWQQRPLLHFSNDIKFAGRRNAKIYKVMPHLFLPGYDYYFWVDVSHEVVMNPDLVIENYMKDSEIGVFKHTQRNCAYSEAVIINELGYDHKENVDKQVELYRSQGFPDNFGLYELPVSIRKNTPTTQLFNMMWFEQICKYSSRDQISFPYCLWKTGIVPKILPGWANGYNAAGTIGNNAIMPQTRNHVSSGPG
jgi:hypothetical protein